MHLGVIAPQGWTGEYNGWEPRAAWARTVAVARQAESLGFESVWLFDHYHTKPEPTDEITFESFTSLTALATATSVVRLGHVVVCAGFRNPGLVAKMISTMDVISGGRMELGLGYGWKRDEWTAYGYGFPGRKERLDQLADTLEIVTRMLAPGRHTHATWQGKHASVTDAINVPKPLQEHLPILVGGNGPEVTWRLAARLADELNLDGMDPAELKDALPTIRARCEEIGRDPATLAVSVYSWWDKLGAPGAQRADHLAGLAALGCRRAMTLVRESADTDEALESLAADCLAAGISMRPRNGDGA